MIEECVIDIGQKVRAQLAWVTSWKSIARQDPKGVIVKFRNEEWVGIDDRKPGQAYCRFREGLDAVYSDAKMTSVQDTTATYRMRAVFMHYCTNEIEIARFFALSIMTAVGYDPIRYNVRILRASSDKQWIIQQETKAPPESGKPEDHLQLALVDFDVTLRDSVLDGAACVVPCNPC